MGILGKKIGKRIEALRTERKVSREKVASAVGIDPVTLYRIEKSKQGITIENIEAIATYFGVAPEMFLTDGVVRVQPSPEEAWEIVGRALQSRENPSPPDARIAALISSIEKLAPAIREELLSSMEGLIASPPYNEESPESKRARRS